MVKIINGYNFITASMDDWQHYIDDIFHERNAHFKKEMMWLKVIEHASKVAEGIRKRKFFEAISSLAKTYVWINSFVTENKDLLNDEKLEKIVWYKYPRVCSYCVKKICKDVRKKLESGEIKGVKCVCEVAKTETEEGKWVTNAHLEEYRNIKRKVEEGEEDIIPKSLKEWGEMYNAIYDDRHALMSLDSVCFHFMEEVGEVLTSIRIYSDYMLNFKDDFNRETVKDFFKSMNRYKKLTEKKEVTYEEYFEETKVSIREEIADVVSWLFALTSKLITLRSGLSDYEENSAERIQKLDIDERVKHLYGFQPTPYNKEILSLPSIMYVLYGNGCPECNNFGCEEPSDKCICDTKISNFVIYNSSPEKGE